jgi:hypothetical protein
MAFKDGVPIGPAGDCIAKAPLYARLRGAPQNAAIGAVKAAQTNFG